MIAPQVTLEAPEDVAANANGMLTAAQRRALRRHLRSAQWSTVLISSFYLAVSLCVLAGIGWLWLQIRPHLIGVRDPLSFTRAFRGIRLTFPGLRLIFGGAALMFALLAWRSIAALRACARARRELKPGGIVSAVGAVVSHQGQPVALVGGRALAPWDERALESVAPGRYRCWFLPRMGWLLSVQRLREWEQPTAADAAVAARWGLAAMNGFDAASLPHNRTGMLTAVQARYVARQERRERPGNLLIGAALLVAGLWLGFSIWHLAWHGGIAAVRDVGVGDVFWEAVAAIGVAVAGAYFLFRGFGGDGYRRDLAERRVVMREGTVTKRRETGDDSNDVTYYYRVNGEDFAVSRRAYDALPDGLLCRVYATPRSKRLVNIECIEGEMAPPAPSDPDWFR
jgi:hypothetical protein